ncbi:MAG: hypothetical protein ACYTF6_07440, partial [Planctomycetota bacterium]
MTRHEIAQLACRILALWLFCQTALSLYGVVWLLIFAIPRLFSDGFNLRELAGPGVAGLVGLGAALIGALLWWKSGRIASRMTSPDTTPVTSANLDQ